MDYVLPAKEAGGKVPRFSSIYGFTLPFSLVALSLFTEPWDCTRTDPTWSSVALLDRADSKTLHYCRKGQVLRDPRVLVLHQKARNVLLTAHVSGVSTATVAATYALYRALDSTPTLNVLPKYTYVVVAPHMKACTSLHYPASPALVTAKICRTSCSVR